MSKNFGVYTFEDKQPLIERKARLIERLVGKKEADGENATPAIDPKRFKTRSIPGGAGHQIVFSSRASANGSKLEQP